MKTTILTKTLLLLFCTIYFVSCVKEEDDSGTICESDCTTITGKIFSSDKQSFSDVGIEVKYYESEYLHHSLTRLKAKTKTNNNSHFNMNFYLKNDEVTKGYHSLYVDMQNLDSKKYIVPQDIAAYLDTTTIADWTLKLKRDTTYEMNLYVPRKKSIKVILKGYKPIHENDYFEVRTIFPWGFEEDGVKVLDTKYGVYYSAHDKFIATKEENVFTEIPFALNETNIIQIFKIKNGIATPEEHEIYVSDDSPETIVYEY